MRLEPTSTMSPRPDTPRTVWAGPLGGELRGGSYRCADCGYGVTLRRDLMHCPMCAGTRWEDDTASFATHP